MKANSKPLNNLHNVRNISIAFLILFLVLISFCVFSYIRAKQIQDQYETRASRSYQQLELINSLFESNLRSQALLRGFITSQDSSVRDSLQAGVSETHETSQRIIYQLDNFNSPERKDLLNSIKNSLVPYKSHTDSLLSLLEKNQRREAATYAQEHFTPYHSLYQAQLIDLSNSVAGSSGKHADETLLALSSVVDAYAAFLLIAIVASISAAFVLLKVFRNLHRKNLLLKAEVKERQELQKSLQENQNQYKALFQNNPLPFIVFDQDTFKILEVNEAAVNEYGYSRDEFNELTYIDLVSYPDQSRVRCRIKHLSPDEVDTRKDTSHQRKDGSIFRVELKTHSLPKRHELHPRIAVITNIQEREVVIDKLQQSEKLLKEVSSSIPGAVYQFQVDSEGKATFPFVSEGITEIYSLTSDLLYKDPNKVFDLIHPDDLGAVNQSIADAVKSVTSWYHEFRLWNESEKKWKWVRGHSLPTVKPDGSILFNGTLIDTTMQREMQEDLLRNEANLQALLNSSPQAIFLLDEHLEVLSFNKVAKDDVKHFLLQDLRAGQNILTYIGEDALPDVKEDHALAMQGKEVVYETGCGDNWYEVSYRPAFSKDNRVLAVAFSIHNITERRNAIEAIKKSEIQLNRAQQLAKIGSWELNIEKDILTGSNSLYEIYGLGTEKDDLSYKKILEQFHPDDIEPAKTHFEQAVKNKTDLAFDHRVIHEDGSVSYLHTVGEVVYNPEGTPLTVIGATQDITELHLKKQEATEAKEKFRTTIENIPETIFSSDAQFNIQYVSPQVKVLTGYDEADFVGDAALWVKVVHPDDLSYLTDHIIPAILSGERVEYELRLITKTGETKWAIFRQSPALDKNGNVIRVDSSVADITERKTEEAKQALLAEQLQGQNEHLQQFAYIVSHNLRTPIANILGLTSIYKKDENSTKFNSKIIDNLTKSAQLLDTTIRDMNDILTIRGQITNTYEKISFEEILQNILTSISQEVNRKHATINFNFEEAPTVNAIRSYVYSILQNLVVNALKYSSPERLPTIRVNTYYHNEYICLSVTDNGLGIDLEKQKSKVFGLYKRFHPEVEGKGLGLYLVKTQAELLGGKVEVDSQVNVGTTFKIFFKNQNN